MLGVSDGIKSNPGREDWDRVVVQPCQHLATFTMPVFSQGWALENAAMTFYQSEKSVAVMHQKLGSAKVVPTVLSY